MKEYVVDLHPIGGGSQTKIRVFASNPAHAIKIAREIYPNYRTGSVKPANK
jgi:hypothetical protein